MAKRKRVLTRAFVLRTVVISTVLMIGLCVLGLVYWNNRPKLLENQARAALDAGEYARAAELFGEIEQTQEIAALTLEARYGAAMQYYEAGMYSEAQTAFSELGDYGDARTMILACRYGLAQQAMQAGDYEAAKEQFYALTGYSDALEQYNAARYAIAAAAESTDAERAFQLFYELGGYADALQQAQRIAIGLTGMANGEDAVNRMLGVSEEEILLRRKLTEARANVLRGRLAVGFYHTVGLKADGSVLAAGSNTDGQCNVSSWSGIRMIDCGAFHTVGLKADGTAVAVGRNESGQCNVSEWTNLVSICCTDYGTIGLQADGTLVHTGYQTYATLDGWTNVALLGGGSYAAVAVTESGQMLSSHPSARSESMQGAIEVDASTGYAVALLANGRVLSTSETVDLPWQEVVSVSAGSTGVLGLTADGRVLTHWFRARDAVDFADVENAVAIACGGTHSAVLRGDGTVVTRGTNENGECNTESWNLN